MKKKFIVIVFLSAVVTGNAQTTPSQYNSMSNLVQPAPNVASMGKYVDYPVSYYTGTPNISIPIYDLKDGSASVPISLSYHSSGIRVSEMASWVGLGWTLNATGMIARSVRGAPDEGSRVGGNGTLPLGYYRDSGLSKLSLLPYPDGNAMTTRHDSNLTMPNYTVPQMQAGASDGEPDLFTFSMNGYGGKFVFVPTR